MVEVVIGSVVHYSVVSDEGRTTCNTNSRGIVLDRVSNNDRMVYGLI